MKKCGPNMFMFPLLLVAHSAALYSILYLSTSVCLSVSHIYHSLSLYFLEATISSLPIELLSIVGVNSVCKLGLIRLIWAEFDMGVGALFESEAHPSLGWVWLCNFIGSV